MENSRHALAYQKQSETSLIAKWLQNINRNTTRLFPPGECRREAMALLRPHIGRQTAATKLDAATDFERLIIRNIDRLATILSIGDESREIVRYQVLASSDATLSALAGMIRVQTHRQFCETLAIVLGIDAARIKAALQVTAPLFAYAILEPCYCYQSLDTSLSIHNDIAPVLELDNVTDLDLMRPYFSLAASPTLALTDFSHLHDEIKLALQYLEAANRQGVKGINIMFVGLPGTGKTELAKIVGRELGLTTYEVKSENVDGSASSAIERLASLIAAQKYLSQATNRLLIFDEIEDIFNETRGVFHQPVVLKQWLNRQLEDNTVPTIWIANSNAEIDAAHLRRFDYSIQFGQLPTDARSRIFQRHFGNSTLTGARVKTLSTRHALLPSQIGTAAKVVSMIGHQDADDIVVKTIDASMRLLAQPIPATPTEPALFDFATVNANINLAELLDALKTGDGVGRLCFAGPSGTGKSAFASAVANALNRQPRVIRASDILSPYVGGNEQNLATLFSQATKSRDVLIFEEADSVLSSRSSAKAHWEIVLVNELLSQLDTYQGFGGFQASCRLSVVFMRRFLIQHYSPVDGPLLRQVFQDSSAPPGSAASFG